MSVVLAWLLALVFGVLIWCVFSGRPRSPSAWLAALGHAVPMGLLACAMAIAVPACFGWRALPASLWWWPLLALPVPALLAWRSRYRSMPPHLGRSVLDDVVPVRWATAIIAVLLGLILLRAWWLYQEAWLRPLFGWDAWLAWSAKAKAWLLSGEALPFVDGAQWLDAGDGSLRTSLAHDYPELLSWLQVWLGSAAGGWHEPAINLIWPTLWLALLAGCYGQWRALSVPRLTAVAGTYVLASLPLANVHAALPGYADLWVATLFAFAVLATLRWRENGDRSQLLLALVLAALLPAIKLEGMVWTAGVLALMLWFGLRGRKLVLRTGTVLAWVLVLLAVSWWWQLPWLRQTIELFSLGQGGSVNNVLTATGAGLFTQYNWHLLWYLLPVVVIWRRRAMLACPSMVGVGLLLAGGLGLLLVLFLCTQAGRWAESFTAINRLVLHIAPIAVSFMVLLLRRRDDEPNASVRSPTA